jgi:hypothetical protein
VDKDTRNAIERATQRARKLLEEDFAAQLEGDFDVHRDGKVAAKAGRHLSARQAIQRERIVAAIEHKRAAGFKPEDAGRDDLRDAAFTTFNRFVALKMLEARELVRECITKGEQSAGYYEFCGMAPGLPLLPDSAGYRLYIESLFDELSTEVKVLFDRRDPSSVLWPRRATFEQLLELLNAAELANVWGEDETIGWVYQFFNGQDERRRMREESQTPRNSRELAVRNQFFTPRYVVQFLTDNTLGRIWYEMRDTMTVLAERCDYMVRKPGKESAPRAKKDPRDLRVLDPACGSGHFLLYAFDLLIAIYEEAYTDPKSPKSEATGRTLVEDYPSLDALRKAIPGLVLAKNLHGVDIDPRCAQIAQLALWMRAQKAYRDFGIGRAERAQIRRSNIVVAEPLVADDQIVAEFVAKLGDVELGRVFTGLVESLNLAGDLGLLIRVEHLVGRDSQTRRGQTGNLFAPPEERIRDALARFVADEGSRSNTRRRLFAEDAAHGVGLLSVAETRFDVVLMNPPFGAATEKSKQRIEAEWPLWNDNLAAAFVLRGMSFLADGGCLGCLCDTSIWQKNSYEPFRVRISKDAPPSHFAWLGWGVLDANVDVAATCLSNVASDESIVWADQRKAESKDKSQSFSDEFIEVPLEQLQSVPFAAFTALGESESLKGLLFRQSFGIARQGIAVPDAPRFIRLFWEVPEIKQSTERKWCWLSHGGEYSPFYRDYCFVINWKDGGQEVKADITTRYPYLKGNWGWVARNSEYYFRPGLAYGKRTDNLSTQIAPAGMVFSNEGSGIFPLPLVDPWLLLAVTNSPEVSQQLNSYCGQHKYSGYIDKLRLPGVDDATKEQLAHIAGAAFSQKLQAVSQLVETSPFFSGPPISIDGSLSKAQELCEQTPLHIAAAQRAIDRLMFGKESLPRPDNSICGAYSSQHLLQFVVGVIFGRFNPSVTTSTRQAPPEHEAFAPIPLRSPSMYPEGQEPAGRPDILVDDEGHADDIVARVDAVADGVHPDLPENLRASLAKDFFPLHIKMYSKSRRKAPIYWQLATSSAGYSVWLYIHAFSKDTLFRVQNDYAAPKLAHEERRLESLTRDIRDKTTAAQRMELAAQAVFVEELRAFLEEVRRVAPLWNPNLDDGVIINFAPLWRLVPQHKPWQKELRSTWESICEGKYDWAQLSMHFWPERVVPKCVIDRSLAIAHGLQEVFWVEGSDGMWTARMTPTKSVDQLVRERTSPAVKAALKSLLDAPLATGSAGGGRGRRKAVAVDEGGDA